MHSNKSTKIMVNNSFCRYFYLCLSQLFPCIWTIKNRVCLNLSLEAAAVDSALLLIVIKQKELGKVTFAQNARFYLTAKRQNALRFKVHIQQLFLKTLLTFLRDVLYYPFELSCIVSFIDGNSLTGWDCTYCLLA